MVRTQIQLTEAQADALHALARERRLSAAELIRMSLDQFLRREARATTAERVERARRAAGKFSSHSRDGSSEHDRVLAEAYLR